MNQRFNNKGCEYEIISPSTVALVACRTCPSDFTIPAVATYNSKEYKITLIKKGAFLNSGVKFVQFESDSHVAEIEDYALPFETSQIVLPKSYKTLHLYITLDNVIKLSVDGGEGEYLIVSNDGILYRKHPLVLLKANRSTIGVSIRESVAEIFGYSFFGCSLIKWVHFPSSVKTIGPHAFRECCHLKRVTFSKYSKLETICFWAFGSIGDDLKEIHFPSSLKKIENCAFQNSNIEIITFNEDSRLEEIEFCAFLGNRIHKVAFPRHLKNIGATAFYNCFNLSHIYFPDDSILEKIGEDTFFNTSISSITCPKHITNILKEDIFLANFL